jgi:hypothetical protein
MSEGMNNEVEKGLHSYTTKCAVLGELFGQSLQGIYESHNLHQSWLKYELKKRINDMKY